MRKQMITRITLALTVCALATGCGMKNINEDVIKNLGGEVVDVTDPNALVDSPHGLGVSMPEEWSFDTGESDIVAIPFLDDRGIHLNALLPSAVEQIAKLEDTTSTQDTEKIMMENMISVFYLFCIADGEDNGKISESITGSFEKCDELKKKNGYTYYLAYNSILDDKMYPNLTEQDRNEYKVIGDSMEKLKKNVFLFEPTDDTAENASNSNNNNGSSLLGKFETKTLNGDTVTEAIFSEADITMVNIWGTFCGPCIAEMPDLGELSKEYADKGVQIVGIISDVQDENDETAKKIVEETGADYTHLVINQQLYNNYLNQVQAVPTTVFLDRDGKLIGTEHMGSMDKASWAKIIDELLEEKNAGGGE